MSRQSVGRNEFHALEIAKYANYKGRSRIKVETIPDLSTFNSDNIIMKLKNYEKKWLDSYDKVSNIYRALIWHIFNESTSQVKSKILHIKMKYFAEPYAISHAFIVRFISSPTSQPPMEQSDTNRMSQIQSRLSVLRSELEGRRTNKYDQLMTRISELS